MALGDGSMFPLIDRSTPIINRMIRRGSGKQLGRALGKVVGMGMQAEPDDEDMEETANNLLEGFGRGLADQLEVADEAIEGAQIEELGHFLFGSEVQDFLTDEAKKELGIGVVPSGAMPGKTEEEGEEEKDEDEDFPEVDEEEGGEEGLSFS